MSSASESSSNYSKLSAQLIEEAKQIALDERSKKIRLMIVDAMIGGGRGHAGSSFSLVEIMRALYEDFLHLDPQRPEDQARDRCILSKGHGCLALYAVLAEKGFIKPELLATFCKPDSPLGGHPERGKIPGVEASTGSLGHGLSIGVGMALRARIDKLQHKVVVILGDGESNEGSVWEAALSAAKHRLTNLICLVDYNKQQSYSSTSEVLDLEPLADKWQAFGFGVKEVNGHDIRAIKSTLNSCPLATGRPSMIICHTVKGKGVPLVEGNLQWHHKNKLTEHEIETLQTALR